MEKNGKSDKGLSMAFSHRLELPSHTKQYAPSFSLDLPRISSLSSLSGSIGEKRVKVVRVILKHVITQGLV